MGISTEVSALACAACGAVVKKSFLKGDALDQLSKVRGRCPKCDHDRFLATVTRTMSAYEAPSTSDNLMDAVLETHTYGHTVSWDDVFELPELSADDLFQRLSESPEAISGWITALRKEAAKANLRPDQRLCAVCGEIFTVELAGHTREGFCSPLCRKRGTGSSGPPVAPAASAGKAVPCLKCGRPVRPRPGGRCMHCGTETPG